MDDRHEEVLGLEIIPEEPEISQTKLDQIDARWIFIIKVMTP